MKTYAVTLKCKANGDGSKIIKWFVWLSSLSVSSCWQLKCVFNFLSCTLSLSLTEYVWQEEEGRSGHRSWIWSYIWGNDRGGLHVNSGHQVRCMIPTKVHVVILNMIHFTLVMLLWKGILTYLPIQWSWCGCCRDVQLLRTVHRHYSNRRYSCSTPPL